MSTGAIGTNWSGNHVYRASALHRPGSAEELQALVARGRPIRALGSRHSFTAIGDSTELVALDRLPGEIVVDPAGTTVSVPGHTTYAELAAALNADGRALHNMASLPHISVAGAVATGTHGSGDGNGNLATAVRELEFVTAAGDLASARAGDPDFPGLVVGLGALGIVTRLRLAVEPFYEVRQRVYEGLAWDTLFARFDVITGAGESVSVFHRFGDRTEQLWVKRRMTAGVDEDPDPDELFGAPAATVPLHPVLMGDPINCTEQLGVPGPWSERLPHFRSGFTPSSGEELQSEFFVARRDTVPALQALRPLAPAIVPLLLVCEVRTIAADELWLSPHHGRDTVSIHFTWLRQPAEVEVALRDIEAALAPFEARPHWGKVFTAGAADIAPLYPRMDDFRRLRDRLDPNGLFDNDWLRQRVLGTA
ncbi:MAG TPA: D-arabinono-1,4-lactone oxidase [Solirubrobacteraceae bacterium]|jgi:xylitol oxidase|nr:D-arabinono-1,4-lactone oxidase [Solirubrobacteraceae bacterium]